MSKVSQLLKLYLQNHFNFTAENAEVNFFYYY